MTLTCIGHSGFAIQTETTAIVFDYYIDPAHLAEAILDTKRQRYVFVSHSHRDHLCHDIFSWHRPHPITRYVIANECRRKLARSVPVDRLPIHFIKHDEAWTDGNLTVRAFDSTDAGLCYVVTCEGKTIFHAGDYTCWHFSEENDAKAINKARGDFHAILRNIADCFPRLDLAMMPVVPNIGGDWAYGPREFLRAVEVDLFVPMHTWGRDREAAEFERYRNPDHGTCRLMQPGQSVTF